MYFSTQCLSLSFWFTHLFYLLLVVIQYLPLIFFLFLTLSLFSLSPLFISLFTLSSHSLSLSTPLFLFLSLVLSRSPYFTSITLLSSTFVDMICTSNSSSPISSKIGWEKHFLSKFWIHHRIYKFRRCL